MEYSEITQCKCENKYVLSKSSVHLKLWIVVLGGYMGVVKVFQRIQEKNRWSLWSKSEINQNFVDVDLFYANVTFLYPLKASENCRGFWCFQGAQKINIGVQMGQSTLDVLLFLNGKFHWKRTKRGNTELVKGLMFDSGV